jgi:hypothetical protein
MFTMVREYEKRSRHGGFRHQEGYLEKLKEDTPRSGLYL